jgi:hypothetical protein
MIKCRYCNASNVFHAQFVPLEPSNIHHVMPLDISLQRYGDAHFHKSVVTKLATATPQKPMDWVRKAQVDAGQRAG